MAANEGTAFDVTAAAEAGSVVLGLVELVAIVIPLLTVAVLVLSHVRNSHDRARPFTSVWPSQSSAGTSYLFGEIDRSEYRRSVASNRRVDSALR